MGRQSTVVGDRGGARGNTDAAGGADQGDMSAFNLPAEAGPTAPTGAPRVRPDVDPMDRAWAAAERAWAAVERGSAPADRDADDDRPVFVDRSGRRRRYTVVLGAGLAVVIVVALIMLVAGLSGSAPLNLPGFPDLAKPAKVTPGPTTQQSVVPPGAGTVGAGTVGSTPAETPDPTPSTSSPRHVPTQTPSHPPKPTK